MAYVELPSVRERLTEDGQLILTMKSGPNTVYLQWNDYHKQPYFSFSNLSKAPVIQGDYMIKIDEDEVQSDQTLSAFFVLYENEILSYSKYFFSIDGEVIDFCSVDEDNKSFTANDCTIAISQGENLPDNIYRLNFNIKQLIDTDGRVYREILLSGLVNQL